MTTLRAYRTEIKYTLLTLVILGIGASLNMFGAFHTLEKYVNAWMDTLANWGYLGLFVICLFSNMTLVILIPYALPLLSLSIYAHSVLQVVGLGIAAGLGAGIGEVTSYAVAHTLVAHVEDLEESALFRWTNRTIAAHPRVIPVLVWLASGTPVPDVMIIVPLAMIRYPWRKMILPMVSGKIFQNVGMALVYHFAASFARRFISGNINFDMTGSFAVIFVMLIAYQIEKAHAERHNASPGPI
jgi:hypothetical protein